MIFSYNLITLSGEDLIEIQADRYYVKLFDKERESVNMSVRPKKQEMWGEMKGKERERDHDPVTAASFSSIFLWRTK